jgi:cytochrome P450
MQREHDSRNLLEQYLQEQIPSSGFYADPYPYFDQMRSISPVFWTKKLNAWLVTDYDITNKGLRDQRFSVNRKQNFFNNLPSEEQEELKPLKEFFDLWLMFIDPPYHEKLKSLFVKPFSPRSLQQFSEEVDASAVTLLSKNSPNKIDFLEDFAIPFSVNALAKILGVDASDYMGVVHWTEQLLSFLGGAEADIQKGREALSAYHRLMEYLTNVLDNKRVEPQNDIISTLVVFLDEGKISKDELIAIVANLLVDGHEPVAHTLSNGMVALLQNPDQLSTLYSRPDLVPQTVEESLRINPFFQYSARRATEDLTLGSTKINKNDRVMFMLGAANRDPQAFDAPQNFIIDRKDNKHLSFGQGIHYCLGAALGRLTCNLALSRIVEMKSNIQLDAQQLNWRQSVGYRGLVSLPISWESR